ncbi:cytochrome P450 2J2-like [Heteronotia binoei]|uniref:cytochrome P450 2J2-like n=1 Tax=Heteronotia binoei TaxID=13085 RepID=UPI0029300D10|nr:cytochrome P450 2J2-like [Heteronotia binoei]
MKRDEWQQSERKEKPLEEEQSAYIGERYRGREKEARTMVETLAILITLLVFLLILYLLKQLWSHSSYPPGPLRLPFVGSVWKLGITLLKDSFIKLVKEYGNVYMLWLGPEPIVVLSGYEAVKEGLINQSELFADRPATPFIEAIAKERGIIFSNGHTWKQQRKFGLASMRKLGLGKKGMEHQIQEEAHQLVEMFTLAKGQPLDPAVAITNSVTNVICAVAFGCRFSAEDKEFLKLVEAVDCITKFPSSGFHTLYAIVPWLMKYLPGPHRKALASVDIIHSFARKELEKHKESLAVHEPQDFIDFYLCQMKKSKNDPKSTFNKNNLTQCIFDLFIAGSETTALTLQWALLLMANHPDIQEKVHKEIEDVLGSSRPFSYQDWKKLPYTNAVIHEIMRSEYILLFGLPRQCTKDVKMFGFLIPKEAAIFPDLRSALFDPKQWEKPQEFNPNHFLDKDGKFVDREAFLPFGAGARVCLGEQLARIEIFIFFTTLLRAFTFQPPEGVKELGTEANIGVTCPPRPYKLCAVPRCSAASRLK